MKKKNIAALLAFLLGGFGAHKFYLRQTGLGVVYICFCWTYIPAIIALIESIRFLVMSESEFNKKYNQNKVIKPKHSEPINVKYQETKTETLEGNTKQCPQCGAPNQRTNKYCESCGYKF